MNMTRDPKTEEDRRKRKSVKQVKTEVETGTHNYQKPWDAQHTYQRRIPEIEVMLPEKVFKTGRMKFLL